MLSDSRTIRARAREIRRRVWGIGLGNSLHNIALDYEQALAHLYTAEHEVLARQVDLDKAREGLEVARMRATEYEEQVVDMLAERDKGAA